MYRIKFDYIEDGEIKTGDYVTCFSKEMLEKSMKILEKYDDIIRIYYEEK